MNKRRLKALAEWLEKGAPRRHNVAAFDMTDGIRRVSTDANCGTACCIAGTAVMFYGKDAKQVLTEDMELGKPKEFVFDMRARFQAEFGGDNVFDAAKELLGLDVKQAGKLFLPTTIPSHRWGTITPAHAARVIRHLIATGEVDWRV